MGSHFLVSVNNSTTKQIFIEKYSNYSLILLL